VLQHADVKFEMLTALAVSKGDRPKTPGELKNEDWMVIAKYAKLLYGFDMRKSDPERPSQPVLHWKVPAPDADFVCNEEDRARGERRDLYGGIGGLCPCRIRSGVRHRQRCVLLGVGRTQP
jgi:hypothetical protein